eukprot:gene44473-56271_t
MLDRGNTISIAGQVYRVSDYGSFDGSRITLNKPYRGANYSSVAVYRTANCTTGNYLISYQPSIRGYYRLNVQTNAVDPVQVVDIFSQGNLGGNFTLTVTSTVDGEVVSYATEELALSGLTASGIESALEVLANIGDVTVA